MNSATQIVLSFPNNTTVDIQGDPNVIKQIIARLDKLGVTFSTSIGFYTEEQK